MQRTNGDLVPANLPQMIHILEWVRDKNVRIKLIHLPTNVCGVLRDGSSATLTL